MSNQAYDTKIFVIKINAQYKQQLYAFAVGSLMKVWQWCAMEDYVGRMIISPPQLFIGSVATSQLCRQNKRQLHNVPLEIVVKLDWVTYWMRAIKNVYFPHISSQTEISQWPYLFIIKHFNNCFLTVL